MPVTRIGKFLESADLGITPSLGIESGIVEECIAEIRRRNIRGAFGSPCFGFREEDLDFLTKTPELEQVWFWDIHLKSIEGLYELTCLRYFGIHEKRPAIDFSKFPELNRAVWHPRAKDCGIESLPKLQNLDLWHFKSADKSFPDLQLPTSLTKLEINWCNSSNLSDFPILPNLRELQFHYCRNLASLKGIAQFAPNLKRLIITRCPNLTDYHSASELGLEHLYINVKGKVVADIRIKAKTS